MPIVYLPVTCSEAMEPETTYPKETSSNSGDKSGLTDPDDEPWTPDEEDKEPTVTITIDDEEDKFIESVTVTGTENVGSVTVTVIDEDGNEVCLACKLCYTEITVHGCTSIIIC